MTLRRSPVGGGAARKLWRCLWGRASRVGRRRRKKKFRLAAGGGEPGRQADGTASAGVKTLSCCVWYQRLGACQVSATSPSRDRGALACGDGVSVGRGGGAEGFER